MFLMCEGHMAFYSNPWCPVLTIFMICGSFAVIGIIIECVINWMDRKKIND